MSVYGYRVHFLEPRLQRSQDFLTIDDVSSAASQPDAVDAVHEQLKALQGQTHVGAPVYFIDNDAEELRQRKNDEADDLPYFTILKVDRSDRRLEIFVETGREQDHDGLRGRDGSESSLNKKAAVRRSWIVLLFPKKGAKAVMLSQVRGRSYAGQELFIYLTRMAQRTQASVDSKGNRVEQAWLGWKVTPCVDSHRLDGILKDSSEHTFRLKRRGVNAQGERVGGSVDLEFVQRGLKKTSPQKFLDALVAMATRRSEGTETERRAQAAADVLTLVEPDLNGVEFTDAELEFSESGKKQRVSSETIDQLFVYPIGPRRPEVHELTSSASKVVNRIAVAAKIEVSLPEI